MIPARDVLPMDDAPDTSAARESLAMRIPTFALPVTLLAAGLVVGCVAKTEDPAVAAPAGAPGKAAGPAVAPEQPARIVGGANSQPTGTSQPAGEPAGMGAGMGQMPPGHPPIGPGQAMGEPVDPHGAPGAAPAAGGGTGGTVKGTISLDPARAADVKAGSVLYIIVRRDAGEGQRGSLIASKKVEVTGPGLFPLSYEVGPENVMMGGTALDGQIRVEARIDQDGDAISKQPGDVIGARAGAVTVPSGGIDFTLAEKM